jgi:hypothetical protein
VENMSTIDSEQGLRRERQRRTRAREEAAKLREVQRLRDAEGMTIHEALEAVGDPMPHSSFHARMDRLRLEGEEGLVDKRISGPTSKVTQAIRGFLVGVARSQLNLPAEDMIPLVQEQYGVTLAKRSVQGILQAEGVARPRGMPGHAVRKERIEGLGLQIIKVVDERIGYTEKLARAIKEKAVSVAAPKPAIPLDRFGRNEEGQFVSEYNAPRPRRDPQVGAVFESVDVKRAEKDLTRLTLRTCWSETIQRKLLCMMALPMVCDGGRFNAATDPRGALLAGLGHIPYMPATLQKIAGELKYLAVSTRLLDTHASFWLEHMKDCLGTEPTGLLVYVDGTLKPLWTEFFHKSGKVSSVGRVMPCLESVLLCAGPGVPLYVQTFSGHAPLVHHLIPTLEAVEQATGNGMFSRLTVVDGGANAFELLRELHNATPRRHFITALRSDQITEKRIKGLRAFYEYRDGDWITESTIKLHNSKNPKEEPLELRAIYIEQRGKGTLLGLTSNAPKEGFNTVDLANAFYSRWPSQEGVIRDLKGGTAFGTIHGYGKSRVLNVSVLTEIEKLQGQISKLETRRDKDAQQKAIAEKNLHDVAVAYRRSQRLLDTADRYTNRLRRAEKTHTKVYRDAEVKQRELSLQTREAACALKEANNDERVASAKLETIDNTLQTKQREKSTLESQCEIYQTDVELDQTCSVVKLGWLCLIWTALHEFFDGIHMEIKTFMNEVLALPGYRIRTATVETIQLIANPRNRPVMKKLEKACERISALKHKRGHRVVRFALVWPADGSHPT